MHPSSRYILIILGVVVSLSFFIHFNLRHFLQISLHYILTFTHKDYGRATSLSTLTQKLTSHQSSDDYHSPETSPPIIPPTVNGTHERARANATFVILARNTDIDGTVRSIRSIEDRFNREYQYPYVFLNEVPFTDEFKQFVHPFCVFYSFLTLHHDETVEFQFSVMRQWSLELYHQNIGINPIP